MAPSPQKKPDPERSQVIRLAKGQANQLERISKKMGTTQGQIVRWAVDALIAKVEKAGGKLVLPFELDLDSGTMLRDDVQEYGKKPEKP